MNSSGVCVLLSLLFLSASADHCDNDNTADNCNKYTEESNNRPRNTGIVVMYEQLKHMMSPGRVQLIDVREPDELKAGFIPGATNIPLGELEEALTLDPDQFRQRYGVSKPHPEDSDIVLYCQKGIRSLNALEVAISLEYSRARHYVGGYREWAERERL